MATTVKLYEDHRTASFCGPSLHITLYLCDEHAEELGDEVTCIETPVPERTTSANAANSTGTQRWMRFSGPNRISR
jgi:hypothetical protein